MVPCDMSDTQDVEEPENLVERLGANKVAQMFVDARKKFLDTIAALPEEARSSVVQQITGAEYKQMMEEEAANFLNSMEGMECGESEEGDDDEAEDDDEPAA